VGHHHVCLQEDRSNVMSKLQRNIVTILCGSSLFHFFIHFLQHHIFLSVKILFSESLSLNLIKSLTPKQCLTYSFWLFAFCFLWTVSYVKYTFSTTEPPHKWGAFVWKFHLSLFSLKVNIMNSSQTMYIFKKYISFLKPWSIYHRVSFAKF